MNKPKSKLKAIFMRIKSDAKTLLGILVVFIIVALVSLLDSEYQAPQSSQYHSADSHETSEVSLDDLRAQRKRASDEATRPVLRGRQYTGLFYQVKLDDKQVHFFRRKAEFELDLLATIPLEENGPTSATMISDTKIVFTDGDRSIKQIDTANHTFTTLLENTPYRQDRPTEIRGYVGVSASPNGEWLLVRVVGYEGAWPAILKSDGTELQPLSGVIFVNNIEDTDWSLDSKQFVIANEHSDFADGDGGLYVGRPENPKEIKQLIVPDLTKRAPDQILDTYQPRFSPDGTKIAFSARSRDYAFDEEWSNPNTEAEHFHEVYTINVDGSQLKQVTKNDSYSFTPFWLDHQTLLYGLSNYYFGKFSGVRSINIATGQETVIASRYVEGKIHAITDDKLSILTAASSGPQLYSPDNYVNDSVRLTELANFDKSDYIDYREACFQTTCQ